ncbi:hypothetical protein [Aquisphaera insulae]|uniref:hypothetical protein n=1 Tax=Aquisphaera insulae TaxID=2712864 RepID=UPI0013ED015C|nr:hypothetical protein [Aquisphaera insulae]
MSSRALLRLTPTLLIMAAMGYAAYAISAAPAPAFSPPAAAPAAPPPKAAGAVAEAPIPDRGRNPFTVVVRVDPENGDGRPAGADGAADPLMATVRGLTLNATFVQGRTQLASINGRLYRQGQRINGPDDAETPLAVAQVGPAHVVLVAGGTRYTLGYPEDLSAPNPAAASAPRGAASAPPRGRAAAPRAGSRGGPVIPGAGPGPPRTGAAPPRR